jgi:hypothetical protein
MREKRKEDGSLLTSSSLFLTKILSICPPLFSTNRSSSLSSEPSLQQTERDTSIMSFVISFPKDSIFTLFALEKKTIRDLELSLGHHLPLPLGEEGEGEKDGGTLRQHYSLAFSLSYAAEVFSGAGFSISSSLTPSQSTPLPPSSVVFSDIFSLLCPLSL